MNDILTDIQFFLIARKESERTLLVHPDEPALPAIEGLLVDAKHLKLRISRFGAVGQVFILDENALNASLNEMMAPKAFKP